MSAETGMAADALSSLGALRPWIIVPGLALMLFALYDLLSTSLQMGEGPLTRAVYRSGHWALHHLRKLTGNREVLVWMAGWLVLATFAVWFFLTWVGWSLLFYSQPSQVVWAGEDQPASLLDTAYFVGYTLTTLGLGDLHATTQFWRIMTSLAALNGFFLLTFSLTFLAPLATAHGERRKLALRIFRAGQTPYDFVLTGLHDHPDGLGGLVHDLSDDMIRLDAKHKSSHYLHAFHDRSADVDLHLQLPVLGEALLLMQHGLQSGPPKGLRAVRCSVEGMLQSYEEMLSHKFKGGYDLPPLTLEPLRRQGVEVVSDAEFAAALQRENKFRQQLYTMTDHAGWPLRRVVGNETEGQEQ